MSKTFVLALLLQVSTLTQAHLEKTLYNQWLSQCTPVNFFSRAAIVMENTLDLYRKRWYKKWGEVITSLQE
jgi:hypothetical protein